ncbi:MAG: hypothetical protein ABIY38_06765 [Rhodococcus sp. (in: high G+C Gram-positive bacteria)]
MSVKADCSSRGRDRDPSIHVRSPGFSPALLAAMSLVFIVTVPASKPKEVTP